MEDACRFDAFMTGACFARLMRLHEASAAAPRDPVGEQSLTFLGNHS